MTTTTTQQIQAVVLNGKTFTAEVWHHEWTDELRGGIECSSTLTILTGPRGAKYEVRPYINGNGLCWLMSLTSGQPMRVKGNQVNVYHLGDIIEVAA